MPKESPRPSAMKLAIDELNISDYKRSYARIIETAAMPQATRPDVVKKRELLIKSAKSNKK
ncbi:MAG: hypothetical protein Q8L35_09490 [Actinomycetota bacterium]|nr:hypothetical protein [Actinomycetota bacterium]